MTFHSGENRHFRVIVDNKRAYKKYYARVMKGNMSREVFNAWVEFAAGRRDATLLLLEGTKSAEEKVGLIERLREELNRV